MNTSNSQTLEVSSEPSGLDKKILTPHAIDFLCELHQQFNTQRLSLLQQRKYRQHELNQGIQPDFLIKTKPVREDLSWVTSPPPQDLIQRKVEITGSVERKMMINAFNSGADVFMADVEDSLSPTWFNVLQGQLNLMDAVNKSLTFTNPEGKKYELNEKIATLIVRPRGWHLYEKHFKISGQPLSASLFDFGCYFYYNAKALLKKGSGPYFYLPKLENHLEARLWNEVFLWSQGQLGLPKGTIKATVLIENILAAFEMEEILYELREHCVGLNAGRWDYLFSIIKKFQNKPDLWLPDRGQITMTVPFMRAYTTLLVQTCHKRKAHALGGMAAFIPNRKDKTINEIALKKVREDKEREVAEGFDGTWVAHPDLVPEAMAVFNNSLKDRPHQKENLKVDVNVTPQDLLNFNIPNSSVSEAGVRQNINVSLLYIESWLNGLGAAALYNLMEDTATAEISRAQLWHWIHQRQSLPVGKVLTPDYFQELCDEEYKKISTAFPPSKSLKNLSEAKHLLEKLVLSDTFEEFLTLPAYEMIP